MLFQGAPTAVRLRLVVEAGTRRSACERLGGRLAAKARKRLNLAQRAKDWLWSESGGHCQNPTCRVDLHGFIERKHIGELAHIIPASTDGPRAEEGPGLAEDERALPENLIVLCPTCHTVVDKAPTDFPAAELRRWKRRSQQGRAIAHGTPVFTSRLEARKLVERLLGANRAVFTRYGPREGVFDDSRADQWRRHVQDTIIPNNRELMQLLQANRGLLTESERSTADLFAVHVQELEERHLEGDWTPGSTTFPTAMDGMLEDKA
jgi:5-methylcytosine-specific restriction endonuclease McrA